MSVILQLIQVSLARHHKQLFHNLNLSIHDGDRIGLVGHNGSGKSSLLNVMSGRERPDAGDVRTVRHLHIAYVEQFVPTPLHTVSLREAVRMSVMTEQGWEDRPPVETVLQHLGFTSRHLDTPVHALSGGQHSLLLLARALVQQPQLLLMDEPGNHLDIQAMSHMQQFLAETSLPWLMVSHDRTLLNAVCTRTLFLRDERLYAFDLPYDQATVQLRQHDAAAAHARVQEQREIARLTVSAKRLATWGKVYDSEDLARKAKSMEKRIDRLEAERTFVSRGSGLRLALATQALAANQVLYVARLPVCAVPGQPLYTIDELLLKPGDRVALLGVNGVGKSTTFTLLRQHYEQGQPQPQHLRFHPQVTLGYYDQQLADLHVPLGRLDWLRQYTNSHEEALKQVLIQAGVPFADFQQPVAQLSGGEKARMMFMRLRLEQANFLILDEPTNHLDLEGKEQLEAALLRSAATLLMTSHDRTFLDRVATRWLWIHQGRLQELTSPAPFYHSLLRPQGDATPAARPSTSAVGRQAVLTLADQDAMLARLDVLERLLQEDVARKPRFQKPARQQQWRAEIAQLWRQLEGQ